MSDLVSPRPVVLAILDGWGHRRECEDNAICQATTPNLDHMTRSGPSALIDASELEVGLPSGQMGNSEVGHMNLGAGRIVLQDLPRSALEYVAQFQAATRAPVATVSGRYYAMDRDKRWERTERAYRVLVSGAEAFGSDSAEDPCGAIEEAYRAGKSDEFVPPIPIGTYPGMRDGDGLLMANFRADRVRQILHALLDPEFDRFARGEPVAFAAALGMVSYSSQLDRLMPSLFPPLDLRATLGEVVSEAGLKQLRIAETEKYAHVTFFFNGGREETFDGEERILIPSPKVATYDLKPEMSAPEVTERLCEAVAGGRFELIVVNYANGDMVGHTGNLAAAIRAVEAVDACLGRLTDSVRTAGGCLLITSDHGNAEQMDDPATGQPHTAHTMNRVPVLLVNAPAWVGSLSDGRLADIAPTILQLMGLEAPAEMTGRSLIKVGTPVKQKEPARAVAE